ncbi:MAG: ABC transporter substrate-binding protein, partial [Candidatus Wallbacteria bacterium]|nr:ABC transporter substrate-binding protein [Candidatus Wallbacteria bacterium]
MRTQNLFRIFLLLFFSIPVFSQDFGLERILERKKITVAVCRLDTPPFFYLDDRNQLKGIDVDLAGRIASALGVELEIVRTAGTFDAVVEQVTAHQADIGISNLSITMERAKRVAYTQPYFVLQMSILADQRKMTELKPGQTVDELLNNPMVKIGILHNSSYEDFVKKDFPRAEAVGFRDWDSAVSAAKKGKLTAIFYDEMEIEKSIREEPSLAILFKKVVFPNRLDRIAMIVPEDSRKFREWLDLFLLDYNHTLNRDLQFQLDRYFTDAKCRLAARREKQKNDPAELRENPGAYASRSERKYMRLAAVFFLFCLAALVFFLNRHGKKIFRLKFFSWLLSPWA